MRLERDVSIGVRVREQRAVFRRIDEGETNQGSRLPEARNAMGESLKRSRARTGRALAQDQLRSDGPGSDLKVVGLPGPAVGDRQSCPYLCELFGGQNRRCRALVGAPLDQLLCGCGKRFQPLKGARSLTSDPP